MIYLLFNHKSIIKKRISCNRFCFFQYRRKVLCILYMVNPHGVTKKIEWRKMG